MRWRSFIIYGVQRGPGADVLCHVSPVQVTREAPAIVIEAMFKIAIVWERVLKLVLLVLTPCRQRKISRNGPGTPEYAKIFH